MDNVVLNSEISGKMQVFLVHLNDSLAKFEMPIAPPACEILLHDWVGQKPNFFRGEEWVD